MIAEAAGDPAPTGGVLLTLAYDGAAFVGWARQASLPSVVGALERAIATVDPRASSVRGASRTDARVHAAGQLAAFDTTRRIQPRGWVNALNLALPPTVAVVRAALVPLGYDPRREAVSKRYRYTILHSYARDPFWETRAWRLGYRLHHAVMNGEAATLLGTHDFRGFRSAADDRTRTVRTLSRVDVRDLGGAPRRLKVTVEGDGFMHNMVRIIVGTLTDVGRGRLAPGVFARALASGNRADLGVTAPAGGLCLESIELSGSPLSWWPESPPVID